MIQSAGNLLTSCDSDQNVWEASCKLKCEVSEYADMPATAVNCDLLWNVVGFGVYVCGK